MDSLPNEVLVKIFYFCGHYNLVIRHVCKIFRDACPKIYILDFGKYIFSMGYLNIIQHYNLPPLRCFVRRALMKGRIKVVKWAVENGFVWDRDACFYILYADCSSEEKLILLKYALANGATYDASYSWLAYKDKNILNWFLEADFPSNFHLVSALICEGDLERAKIFSKRDEGIHLMSALCNAFSSGNIEILEWLWGYRDLFDNNVSDMVSFAVQENHLDAIKWARDHEIDITNILYCHNMEIWEKGDSWECIKWCLENGCVYNEKIAYYLGKFDKVQELLWLKHQGYDISQACVGAISMGNTKLCETLDVPFLDSSLQKAIDSNNPGNVEWLLSKKCPLENFYVSGGSRMVKYLYEKGFCEKKEIIAYIFSQGLSDLTEWMKEHNLFHEISDDIFSLINSHTKLRLLANISSMTQHQTNLVYLASSVSGAMEILQWCKYHGHLPDDKTLLECMKQSAKSKHMDVVKFLSEL